MRREAVLRRPLETDLARSKMYFLSIFQNQQEIVQRRPFADFSDAVAACGDYYEPRTRGAVLEFHVQVTGKVFRRATASLTRPQDVAVEHANSPVAWKAVKQSNAFRFDHSFAFLIENEMGMEERERWKREDDEDET